MSRRKRSRGETRDEFNKRMRTERAEEEQQEEIIHTGGRYSAEKAARGRNNISSWFITVSTHTHIGDNALKAKIMEKSFDRALTRLFTTPLSRQPRGEELHRTFFVPPMTEDGKLDPVYKKIDALQEYVRENPEEVDKARGLIRKVNAEWGIEVGSKQKRMDCHIILEVTHAEKIMFNRDYFEYLMRKELRKENEKLSQKDYPDDFMWKGIDGNNRLYVNFKNLGGFNKDKITKYITKQKQNGGQPRSELGQFLNDTYQTERSTRVTNTDV